MTSSSSKSVPSITKDSFFINQVNTIQRHLKEMGALCPTFSSIETSGLKKKYATNSRYIRKNTDAILMYSIVFDSEPLLSQIYLTYLNELVNIMKSIAKTETQLAELDLFKSKVRDLRVLIKLKQNSGCKKLMFGCYRGFYSIDKYNISIRTDACPCEELSK